MVYIFASKLNNIVLTKDYEKQKSVSLGSRCSVMGGCFAQLHGSPNAFYYARGDEGRYCRTE